MKNIIVIVATIFVIIMIFTVTRCDHICEANKLAKKAQEQRTIFDIKTDEAGDLINQLSGLLEEATQAKLLQRKYQKGATELYSGIALNIPVGSTYAVLDEPTENQKILQGFYLDHCRLTNHDHEVAGLQLYAIDIACTKGVHFDVRAPLYYDEYEVVSKGYDNNLGNYIVISANKFNYLFGHTYSQLKVGDKAGKGAIIGNTDMSGASTAPHVHIEVWDDENNTNIKGDVNPDSQAVLDKRKAYQDKSQKYYFTHYTLGDKLQNDDAPCNGASGKNLCDLQRQGIKTMALTKDIRLKLGVRFGDKVRLIGDVGCAGVYQVEDEMNCRFRGPNAHDNGTCYNRDRSITNGNIKRPGTNYFIKGDLPDMPGGACSIELVK